MAWYSYPNSTDTEGVFEFFRYVNTTADNLFFLVILLVVWVVAFVGALGVGGTNRPSAARSWTFASFICSVLSIMLAIMKFIAPKFMYMTFILVAIGILWIKIEDS